MSPSDPDPATDPTVESATELPTADCIAAFRAKDGSVVIYDEREHTAWIQSNTALDIDETR